MSTVDDRLSESLMHHRILVLGEEVDDPIVNRLRGQLLLLSLEDPAADVLLVINSPGGSVSAALSLYDTMRAVPNDVATIASGMAASAGQFLLSAGTPGKRYAQPHARVLMHQGSAGFGGSAVDVAIQAENLEATVAAMLSLTAEHTGHDLATIVADSDRDRWFDAEAALAYGFVDAVTHDFPFPMPRPRAAGVAA